MRLSRRRKTAGLIFKPQESSGSAALSPSRRPSPFREESHPERPRNKDRKSAYLPRDFHHTQSLFKPSTSTEGIPLNE